MKPFSLALLTTILTLTRHLVNAVYLDLNDYASLQKATSLIAVGLMDYYIGDRYGGTVGMFSQPYYWWEAGGAWGTLLDYWFYMQNDTYNDLIMAALLHQTGENDDYVPLNQSTTEGNDDQAFWGIAVLQATERNFTNPPADEPHKQWLYLSQAVFNTMALRWDSADCGGGLRWQIFVWNSGYDYKNSVSNGALFHIAARLARYTGNETYVYWANKVFDWMYEIGLISHGANMFVYDGASITNNCTKIVPYQWTYNAGLILAGAAYMYNYTKDEIWLERTHTLLKSCDVFFVNNIIYEAACQPSDTCNNDQRSFKGYLARFMGLTAQLVESTQDQIMTYLNASAYAAAKSCSGGYDGHTCGLNWFVGKWDGKYGLGEQMNALDVMVNTQVLKRPAPYTSTTGGSSKGNGAAGCITTPTNLGPLGITSGTKAAAAIITIVVAISIFASGLWLVV